MKFVELEGKVSSWREELEGELYQVATKVSGLEMAGSCLEGKWGMRMEEVVDWLKRSVEELRGDCSDCDEKSRKESHNDEKSRKESHYDEKSRKESHYDEKSRKESHNDEKSRKESHNDEKSRKESHSQSSHDTPHNSQPSQPSQEFSSSLLSLVSSTCTHLHTLNETLTSLPPFADLSETSSLALTIPAGIRALTQFETFLGILVTAGKCREVAERITAGIQRLQELVKKLQEEETALRRWSNVETEIPDEWWRADVMKLPREKVDTMEQALQRGVSLFDEWNRGDFNEQMEAYLGNMRRIVEETAEMVREKGKMCAAREGRKWREK